MVRKLLYLMFNVQPTATVDKHDDSSDEDVWDSIPTVDEPPKKSEF